MSQIAQQSELFPSIQNNLNEYGYRSLTGTIAGIDEVGRGPLIGEVVAAAVILPAGCSLALQDSKKLTEGKREVLSELIREEALAFAIGVATPAEIDEINILQATMLAMQRAMNQVGEIARQKQIEIERVYVDGNRAPQLSHVAETVVKGDAKVAEISAASIIAKVYRDRQMIELDEKYPEYGFAKHKGYPTAEHLEKIKKFGLIDGYRKSFKPIKVLLEGNTSSNHER
ncbi:ribonuclease HII [Thiomicrorhabdus indica]|uniref:ribonuclease HII n=1 Tax=Thiomicrorhabdus indica TaxID=2267253 RepID=UPI00102E0926|nr:ribonuclease HII [Thiomicrorhabdus indica]